MSEKLKTIVEVIAADPELRAADPEVLAALGSITEHFTNPRTGEVVTFPGATKETVQ